MLYLLRHDHLILVLSFFFVMINFFCRANFSWPQVPLCCCTLFQPPASWQCKLNGPSWDLVCCDLLKAYTYIGLWLLWPALTSKNNAGKWFATTKWITCVVTMAHQRLTCRSQDWSGYPAGCLQLPVRFWKRTWNNHKTSMFCCFQKCYVKFFHRTSACMSIGMPNNFHSHLAG